MAPQIGTIEDVVQRQLCTGCGACAFAEPDRFRMKDVSSLGRRPVLRQNAVPESGAGMKVCPGIGLKHTFDRTDPELLLDMADGWGPVYAVWEGYAGDAAIQKAGSSGGAATALSLYCLENEGMGQVVHTAADQDAPYLNKTVFSKTREDILKTTGSRYAPASPCEGLSEIVASETPSVFVGKPCDVAATAKARGLDPALDRKLGLTIAFCCAGVPSTAGNLELARRHNANDPDKIKGLKYRGNGWPGMWELEFDGEDGEPQRAELTYADSWGFIHKFRQWRCYICPDHSGEFADIGVGDPWYRPVEPGEPGKSLIVARTKRGLEIIERAAAAGYIVLETKDQTLLPRSQPHFLVARGNLWARLIVLRVMGAGVPDFRTFVTFRYWLQNLSFMDKLRSFVSTAKRVGRKKLNKKLDIEE
jgi:coenzyme F420 hydrogenase subunit beta